MSTGFLLGLTTGPACLVSCGPALLPMVMTHKPDRGIWILIGRFLSGRLTAYILIGIVSSGVGSVADGFGYRIGYCGHAMPCGYADRARHRADSPSSGLLHC